MQKASHLKMMNNFSSAIPLLESISLRYNPNVYCLKELADCYLQIDNFEKANNYLQKAAGLSPGNYVLLQLLGENFEQEGKKDSANLSVIYYLGSAYTECFNSKKTIECFNNGIPIAQKVDSVIYLYYSTLSTAYHNQKEYKKRYLL